MNFSWNEDTIRWYKAANSFTGFYRNIADAVTPMLKGYKSLCDLGCGLGLVDLELCNIMESIDCVDINQNAIESLNNDIAERGIKNIKTWLKDCDELDGKWDVIYMSFFGSRELDRFLPYCKKLIAVVGTATKSEIVPYNEKDFRKNTVESAQAYLNEKNISNRITLKTFEFGQPFTSREEAIRFIRTNSPSATDADAEEFLAKRLTSIEHEVYSLYLPRPKSFGIFELDGEL